MSVSIGPGWSIGPGVALGGGGGGGGPADPATNTGGFSLAAIAGLPQNLYPAVNVYDGTSLAKFIVNPASTYGTPAGFTFLNNWFWSDYDPNEVNVYQTNNPDDTAQALVSANNAVRGNIAITPSTKRMFSVTHTTWSGVTNNDGVGVGSASTSTVNGDYLGNTNQAVGIYDNGSVWTNGTEIDYGYAIFETNGQIIDVAVDMVNYKMWYRVAGGAWQG